MLCLVIFIQLSNNLSSTIGPMFFRENNLLIHLCYFTGTVRRFLESHGNSIEAVVFAVSETEEVCMASASICFCVRYISEWITGNVYIRNWVNFVFNILSSMFFITPLAKEERGIVSSSG